MTDARAALVEQVAREMCQLRYPVSHADHPDFWSQLAPRGKNRWLRQAEYVLARERAAMERTREATKAECKKERVVSTDEPGDRAYNLAIQHCIDAIDAMPLPSAPQIDAERACGGAGVMYCTRCDDKGYINLGEGLKWTCPRCKGRLRLKREEDAEKEYENTVDRLTSSERKALKRVTNEMWARTKEVVEGREPRFGHRPHAIKSSPIGDRTKEPQP